MKPNDVFAKLVYMKNVLCPSVFLVLSHSNCILPIPIAFECILCSGCNETDDCNKHGSCNKEQHLCYCEYGYTGELCESGKIFGSVILETYSHDENVISLSLNQICACLDKQPMKQYYYHCLMDVYNYIYIYIYIYI